MGVQTACMSLKAEDCHRADTNEKIARHARTWAASFFGARVGGWQAADQGVNAGLTGGSYRIGIKYKGPGGNGIAGITGSWVVTLPSMVGKGGSRWVWPGSIYRQYDTKS